MPDRALMKSILSVATTTIIITVVIMALSVFTGGFAAPTSMARNEGITLPVAVHLATVIPALFLGPIVLWRKKGDGMHRLLGRIWAVLMLTTAIASAFIHSPGAGIAGSGYSVLHIFTIWTLVNVPLAVWFARQGKIERHRSSMMGIYVGLCIAGAFSFIPGRIVGNFVFG